MLEAIAAGLHVIADKPFAPNVEGGRELDTAAKAKGVVFAGLRPIDDLAGWGYEREDLWGTLRTACGAERVPSEQGRYHDYYTGFARAVKEGGAPPVTAEEAIQTLEVLDAAYLSSTESRVVTL